MTFVTTFEGGECILHLDDSFCDRSRSVGKRWKGTFLQYFEVQKQVDRLCEFVSAFEVQSRVCLWLKPELSLPPESISGVSLGTLGFQESATSAKGESELAFLALSGKGDRAVHFPQAALRDARCNTSINHNFHKVIVNTGLFAKVTNGYADKN